MSSVGKMVYTCEGDVAGDEVTAKVATKKGALTISGKRK